MKEVEQHNFALERQLVASVHAVQEVEEKLISAQDISAILRKQLDEIQLERDNALREAEELRKGNTLVTEEVKMQIDNVMEELQATRKQIFLLQRQLADSERMVKELQEKNDSSLELLTMSKKERDVIQLERDNALREAEKLRKGNTLGTEEVKMRIDNLTEELRAARKQIFPLRRKLADSDRMVKELEDKKDSALELLAISKKDQDVIQLERDNALREAAELRKGNTLVTEEVKMQKDNVMKELRAARKQIFPLRRKLADYDRMVKELEDKNDSALELLTISKKDQDVIQLERDNALREAEKLRKGNTLVTEELKMQKDNVTKELRAGRKQISALRRQLADSDRIVKELEDKNDSALELLTISKKEQAVIQLERDNALRETEELRKGNTLVTEEVKMQKDNVTKELRAAMKQMSALRRQLADSDGIVKELKDNTLELLTISKNERDEIQLERDNAIREAEELRQGIEDVTANLQMMQFFSVFSLMEIEKATHGFDPWLIIGRGGYGNVFRGTLRNTDVAIKRLHPNSSQGHSEFQKEVDVLSRVRHPNLVTLIGTCPEDCALIYEYLPNGSLEDRLAWEKNKTLPLSWQTRTRIAAEICSALIFLHSNKPHVIVHGDLKPANVLLDANFVSKLGDFGICRLVRFDGNSTGSSTPLCQTTPKGTLGYMDPEFFSTGELTPKSDVFAFGIVLLQLLTRRPAMGLVNEVQTALRKGSISAVLDASAGEWPLVQANELARLALWCCEMNRRNRPDLVSEVWRVLEPLKASYGDSSLS